MDSSTQLLEGVIIMLILITLAFALKKIGLVAKNNSSIFSGLVLKVTLPALIFSALAVKQINPHILNVSAIVTSVEIICLIFAYLLARLIKLERGETGALMLVSSFGMSTLLGYPIIKAAFPNNAIAFEDAVLISEFGVGLLLFIVGPIIAMHYGQSNIERRAIFSSIRQFFTSPIFIAIILGILVSFLNLPQESQWVITTKKLLVHIGNANMLLVALTIGILIDIRKTPGIFTFLAIAVTIKLLIQPVSAQYLCSLFDIDGLVRQVTFIETSLPSAVLVAIYAQHYKCKPEIVSTTIVITLLLSLISVTGLFNILF